MTMYRSQVIDSQLLSLSTTDTATGAIATFDTDLTENLVSVKCQIVAKQASGTPSPDNPLPIQTYTEMNVSVCGKNWFFVDSACVGKNYDGYSNVKRYSQTIKCPSNTYTFICKGALTDFSNVYVGISKKPLGNTLNLNADTIRYSLSFNTAQTVTTNSEYPYLFILAITNQETLTETMMNDLELMIEKGNTASETYAPYNGTTSNIPFGQTVANGVLDITTGKLTITHGIKDLGTINYTFSANDSVKQDFNSAGIQTEIKGVASTVVANMACEQLRTTSRDIQANNPTSVYYSIAVQPSGVLRIITPPNTYATVTDLKTALSNCLLVFEYLTPIEIQLDSITLQALLNENNIWCDTGDTEVKFLLTVGKKIS